MPPTKHHFKRNSFDFVFRPVGVTREETRALIAQSRQLLRETDEIAKGYEPSVERYRLLEQLTAARLRADEGALCVTRQRRLVGSLIAAGEDSSDAKKALLALEKTSSRLLSDMEKLLDQLEHLNIPA